MTAFAPIWAVGLMTGTVLDGNVDIALIRTDGVSVQASGPWTLAPYPAGIRPLLQRALDAARAWAFEGPEPPVFAEAEAALTRAQSAAVQAFLASAPVAALNIIPSVVGFHGQTVLHRAPVAGQPGATRQLGDGALMASLLGIPVVHDFRSADVRAGGQGAPLSACYHAALLRGAPPGTAVLNLGGVGNLTWMGPNGAGPGRFGPDEVGPNGLGPDGIGSDRVSSDWVSSDWVGLGGEGTDRALIAFDTGPANAPINDWIERHTGAAMDRDGALARAGRVDEARLIRLLQHPYFAAPPPKSLDRFGFTAAMADGLNLQDGAATLTAFAAAAVGRALDLLPHRPTQLAVCGGGRRNPALMDALRARAGAEVLTAEDLGWRGDAVEAECFAFLAVRTLRGLPISFPGTTGVPMPMTGGTLSAPFPSGVKP